MLFSTLSTLVLVASVATATRGLERKPHEPSSSPLEVRQTNQYCTTSSICSVCFGAGYVPCSSTTCFNPGAGEQCCSDGKYCVGPDTSCCGTVDAGVTGSDGIPGATSTVPSSPSTLQPQHRPPVRRPRTVPRLTRATSAARASAVATSSAASRVRARTPRSTATTRRLVRSAVRTLVSRGPLIRSLLLS
ncbi:hypothetical protein BJ546DRAFT_561048 [Cryomyces antarcticus]